MRKRRNKYKSHDIDEYDIQKQLDPLAKESSVMKKTWFHTIEQDGDAWFETIYHNRKTGRARLYFVSQKTGMRKRDEPPTGASLVVYLKDSARERRMKTRD
jgi:hypothetical protein